MPHLDDDGERRAISPAIRVLHTDVDMVEDVARSEIQRVGRKSVASTMSHSRSAAAWVEFRHRRSRRRLHGRR
jgi:hypothetical protein